MRYVAEGFGKDKHHPFLNSKLSPYPTSDTDGEMFDELAESLYTFKDNKVLTLITEPNSIDFTQKYKGVIRIESETSKLEFKLEERLIHSQVAQLDQLFKNKTILTYNVKPLLSYFKFNSVYSHNITKMIDLKIIEGILRVKSKAPVDHKELKERYTKIKNQNWQTLYKNVYIPLLSIIPQIETYGVINASTNARDCIQYLNYEIEDHPGGRLTCSCPSSKYINAHGLSQEIKSKLRPRGVNQEFLSFDYNHMEISVLQWLSQDQVLRDMLDTEDFYCSLYTKLFNKECNDKRRKLIKRVFISLIYGIGVNSLSEAIGMPLGKCAILTERIRLLFPTSFTWLNVKQQEAKVNHTITDYFGRIQNFTNDYYKSRNFLVQSASAVICLHKLCKIAKDFKVVFSIHDGYIISVDSRAVNEAMESVKKLLTAEESFYAGLKLKVDGKIGL